MAVITFTKSDTSSSSIALLNDYTSVNDTVAYSLGGIGNVLYNRNTIANTGSYTESGKSAALLYSHVISCVYSSYELTGIESSLKQNHTVIANNGSYISIGCNALLNKDLASSYRLSCLTSDVVFGFYESGLFKNFHKSVGIGSFTFAGNAQTFIRITNLSCDVGDYQLAGIDTGLFKDFKLIATDTIYYGVFNQGFLGKYFPQNYSLSCDRGNFALAMISIRPKLERLFSSGQFVLNPNPSKPALGIIKQDNVFDDWKIMIKASKLSALVKTNTD